ncbi:MAG: hypothetical protein ACREPB_01375 [Arenimonas sp.]
MPSQAPSSFFSVMKSAFDLLSERHGSEKLTETFDDARSRIAKRLESLGSAKEIEMWSNAEYCSGLISHGFDIAIAYCLEAEQKFKEGGIEQALPALARAHLFLGALGRASEPSVETRQLRSNAAEGGAAKAKKYQPLKDEIIRLLETKCPSEGWRDSAEAIKSIIDELRIFHTKNRISSNLENLLRIWSKKDLSKPL